MSGDAAPVSQPTAPPAPDSALHGREFSERTAPYVQEFARIRTLDICALHDVAAAERITGSERFSLRLQISIDTCELELKDVEPVTSWRIELGYGRRMASAFSPTVIAGIEVLKDPDESTGCDYLVPSAGGFGLTVHVTYSQAPGSRLDDAAVCRTVERYLAEIVFPAWVNPPTLSLFQPGEVVRSCCGVASLR